MITQLIIIIISERFLLKIIEIKRKMRLSENATLFTIHELTSTPKIMLHELCAIIFKHPRYIYKVDMIITKDMPYIFVCNIHFP